MHRNFDLQLTFQETEKNPKESNTREWISAFNTSLLTTRASQNKNSSQELSDLMQTPEFASLLVAAQHLAQAQSLSKEEATERVIETFRKIDSCWNQIILQRGLQSVVD